MLADEIRWTPLSDIRSIMSRESLSEIPRCRRESTSASATHARGQNFHAPTYDQIREQICFQTKVSCVKRSVSDAEIRGQAANVDGINAQTLQLLIKAVENLEVGVSKSGVLLKIGFSSLVMD